jgi:D-alanyl-lipoteichoic acid acyltransferase DltB (MBOAT superfamily)
VQRWWQVRRGDAKPSPNWFPRFTRGFATFHFVVLAWIFFRAETFDGALDMLSQLVSGTFGYANVTPGFAIVLGAAVFFHYLPKDWYAKSQKRFVEAPALVQAVSVTVAMACIQYVSSTGSAPFVYQKF